MRTPVATGMVFDGKPLYIDRMLPLAHPKTGKPVHVVEMKTPDLNALLVSREYHQKVVENLMKASN